MLKFSACVIGVGFVVVVSLLLFLLGGFVFVSLFFDHAILFQ